MLFVVNGHDIVFDFYGLAGQSDDSLNEKLSLIVDIAEDNDFTAHGVAEAVADFVNQNIVAVLKGIFHGRAVDKEGLNDKVAYRDNNRKGDQDDFDRLPEK